MARRTIEERIAQLEARKKSLQARLDKQDRARDTRRKVLLGALVLQRLEAGHDPAFTQRLTDWLCRELPGFLTREVDRALFADLIGSNAIPENAIPEAASARPDQAAISPQAGATGEAA